MEQFDDLMRDYRRHFGASGALPEYRQVELYSKHKKLPFAQAVAPAWGLGEPGLLGVHVAFMLLDSALFAGRPDLLEGKPSWDRYLALPRANTLDKLAAEVFRLLRLFRLAALCPDGRIELRDGLVRASCTFERRALSLNVTPAGLRLLEGFVHLFLSAPTQPYGDAYLERLLLQYFTDIVGEVRKFNDEDRALYQFRSPGGFNRHFRLDCDNPRLHFGDGRCRFEIGPAHKDAARFPIDFYFVLCEEVHILPVEALTDGAIDEAELPRWRAREAFRRQLPYEFRHRFGREEMVVGLPMT